MAVLNMTDQMTALEIARRANAPDPFLIIDLMRLTNEMLIDVPAYEANNGVVNIALQRNIRPMGEASAIIKGMGLTQAETLIYGDGKKPEEFDGLMARRNRLGDPNVVNAGGTGNDLTSIYLVAVGKDLFHLIYPKGSKSVGVNRADNGLVHIQDPNDAGKKYPVYQDYFTAQYGISVIVPDAVKRICNIPKDISGDALIDLIIDTRYRMPKGASTYAMYSNVEVLVKLDKAARDKGNVVYTKEDPWGKPVTHVRDIRCRQMDVILSTEEAVA